MLLAVVASACKPPSPPGDGGQTDGGQTDGGQDAGRTPGADGGRDGGDGGCGSDLDCQASLTGSVCTAGECACPPSDGGAETACGGACVDTLADPANCGACGFACPASPTDAGPSACIRGRCLITVTQQPASGLALWGPALFGTNFGANPGEPIVWQVDLEGGGLSPVSAENQENQWAEAPFVDGRALWWFGANYGIASTSLDGGPFSLVQAHGEQGSYVDAEWLYSGPPYQAGDIVRLPRADPLDGGRVLLASGATAFVIDDGYLYWAASGSPPKCTDGAILARPLSGGRPRVLAAGQHQPTALTLDQGNLYWLNLGEYGCVPGAIPQPGDGTLMAVARDGGATVTLASSLTWPGTLALGRTTIFWTDNVLSQTDVRIESIRIDGGAPTLLVGGQPSVSPPALVATSGTLFWNDTGTPDAGFQDGRVMELLPVAAAAPAPTRGLGMPCVSAGECESGACCAGTCTNEEADLANCGACGASCSAGQACDAGRCGYDCARTAPACLTCAPGASTACLNAGGTCLPAQRDLDGCDDGGCGFICAADCSASGACPGGFVCTPLGVPADLGICACGGPSLVGTPCWCADGGLVGTAGCRTTADCPADTCTDAGACTETGSPCGADLDCPTPACFLGECVLGYGCLPAIPFSCGDAGICPG